MAKDSDTIIKRTPADPDDVYKPVRPVRIVSAASLFDGHDVAINIMRRLLQATGCEVIHLGHDRSVDEVVTTAIQEDARAVAITSYQGGHIEYFKYMFDLFRDRGAGHIKIFGGGGGVILPDEIRQLMDYGITRIYTPEDGRRLGLQGMINDLVQSCDQAAATSSTEIDGQAVLSQNPSQRDQAIARIITMAENEPEHHTGLFREIEMLADRKAVPVLGITGTGGAGKSSLVDELVRRHLHQFPNKKIGIISVDPTRQRTGGALLGDRIRMNAIHDPRVYMRSLATRQKNTALSPAVQSAVRVLKAASFDLIILETSGIGQSDTEIVEHSDVSLYVMTPEYGAASQLEKIDMLDYADIIALNKFDKRGAEDALRDIRKQYQRNRRLFEASPSAMPVIGTIASQFNDPGTNRLFHLLSARLYGSNAPSNGEDYAGMQYIIPPARSGYLAEIVANNRDYDHRVEEQIAIAEKIYSLKNAQAHLESLPDEASKSSARVIGDAIASLQLDPDVADQLSQWDSTAASYKAETFSFKVRDKMISVKTATESLAHTRIPRVAFPAFRSWGDRVQWLMQENVPGKFPYTAGIYPFKREEEDPTRMFAGEGEPERTNTRFHYLSRGMPAKRLSTAFDSVTLYGQDPDHRPDIYGKVGNSGVSICCLDDMKKLYSGFNLVDAKTSVSMTINGPAPMILGYFLNAAIDQQCELHIRENGLEEKVTEALERIFSKRPDYIPQYKGEIPEGHDRLGLMLLGITGDEVLPREVYEKIKASTLGNVRGTVQADILKEDQAQNTCIFSTEFALRLMGDVQAYFAENRVRNFYSISVSGYHIAEAGANPITQLAFTLANGFTYVEYFLSRGLRIDDFAPNLSFFFSNGIDPEYAVIGRVARRIWSKALRFRYGGNTRSRMLKYHIQTSGRSLHAREIDFNDIRTTLQALYAIYDNCNSLHTNAYDEAITTPTEESVRRALAIQLIINKELGLAKNENPMQGSFIIEELTDLVEEAVLSEFERINDRGGVLGAMETMYQRGKIQEESLYYETLKHTGQFPIIGINTFLNPEESSTRIPEEVTRATADEKERQIVTLKYLHEIRSGPASSHLKTLKETAIRNENLFACLMEASKDCSLGQLTTALFEVGGRYRRAM